MEPFVLAVHLNTGQHNRRTLWSSPTLKDGLEMHGQIVADHALRCGDPSIEGVGLLLVHRQEVAYLGPVAMGEHDAPILLEQVDNIAHDPGEHFCCILSCLLYTSDAADE